MKWEYKRIQIERLETSYYDSREYSDIIDYWDNEYISGLGTLGWELVAVYRSREPEYGTYAIFKRAI